MCQIDRGLPGSTRDLQQLDCRKKSRVPRPPHEVIRIEVSLISSICKADGHHMTGWTHLANLGPCTIGHTCPKLARTIGHTWPKLERII
jgi:hypothetical protein